MANIYLPNKPLCDNTLINILNNNANSLETKINKINEYLKPLNYHIQLDSPNEMSWGITINTNKCLVFSNKTSGRLVIHFCFNSVVQKKPVYSNLYLKSPNTDSLVLASFGYGILEDGISASVFANSDKEIPFKEYTYTLPFEDSYLWEDEPLSKIGAYIPDLPTNKVKTYNNLKSYTSQWNTSNAIFGGFTKYLIQDKQCISGFVDLQNQHINLKKNQYRSGDDLIAGINSNDFLNIIDNYPILLATNITESNIMGNPQICYSPEHTDSSGVTHDAKINILTKDYFISFDPADVLIFYQDTDFTEHPITNPIMQNAVQTTTQRKQEYTLQVDYKFNQYLYQFSRSFSFQNGV